MLYHTMFVQNTTKTTYTLSGPTMVAHASGVQYSDTTPYIRFTWLKKDIAGKKNIVIETMNVIIRRQLMFYINETVLN